MEKPVELDAGVRQRLSWIDLALLLLVMFLWALCFPLIATGLSSSPPLYFAALRSLVAGIGLLVPAVALRHPLPRLPRLWLGILGVGLSYTSAGFAGMFLAGGVVSPGLASVLANMQPLIAAILAFFLLGERLKRNSLIGLLMGFFGIVLTALPGFGAQELGAGFSGMGFIVLGALGVAVGNILLKRIAGQVDSLMATGWQFILGSLPLLALAQWFEAPSSVNWNWSFAMSLLVLGLGGTALPLLLWFWLLRGAELTRLNTFSFLTPIFALVISAIFFAERLQWIQVAGIALSLYGMWQVSR
ncbi:DMT family transporter [Phototrophicus methaneseepsis]|uniref:DMT family transporter n=1 Tax=Phototrophicus methaneseepsis TaxID=2710758 RepID=UPI001E3F5BCB|nr:DMT family transporter [Phototrophicus methaneseepsis]